MGWEAQKGYWLAASDRFMYKVAQTHQNFIWIVVNKNPEGERNLKETVLYRAELQRLGEAMLKAPLWKPSLHVVDLTSKCKVVAGLIRSRVEHYARRLVEVYCRPCRSEPSTCASYSYGFQHEKPY